jgi:hypothetical protein
MKTKRTHIFIPQELVAQIDASQAAEKELIGLRQIKALEAASGSWKDQAHPELTAGAAAWVRNFRSGYDRNA